MLNFVSAPPFGIAPLVIAREAAREAASYQVDAVSPAEWEGIVLQFADASYDQTADYAAAIRGRGRLSRIVVRNGRDAVAAAQVVVLTPPGLSRGLAYVKSGPLWRQRGRKSSIAALERVLRALKAEYADRRRLMLKILLPPDPIDGKRAEKALLDAGFAVRRALNDPNRYLVDLSLSEDEQRASLAQKWRYNLKKALAHKLEFSFDESRAAMRNFVALHERMVQRKRFEDRSAGAALASLSGDTPSRMRPRMALAHYEGRCVAGAVIGELGDTAQYLFGATTDEALRLNAGYALHWWIVNRLRGTGPLWYDLGGEAEDSGLRQFKAGLVGRGGHVVPFAGEFDYWRDPVSRLTADFALSLRSVKREIRKLDVRRRALPWLR